MKVRTKLLLNAVVTIICVLGVGYIGYFFTNKVADLSLSLFETQALPVLKINEVEKVAQLFYSKLIVHNSLSEDEDMAKIEEEIRDLNSQLSEKINEYNSLTGIKRYNPHGDEHASASESETETGFQTKWGHFNLITNKILELSRNFNKEDALALIVGDGKTAYDGAMAELHTKIKEHQKQMAQLRDDAVGARKNSVLMIVSLVLVALVIAIMGALFAIRSVIRPIKQVVAGLKDIAEGEGDLTRRLEMKGNDEVSELARWFDTFIGKLQTIIKNIAESTKTLNTSSTELSSISHQMSSGVEGASNRANSVATATEEMNANMNSIASTMEQASTNVTMVASSTEQMTASINEIAQNSEKARNITRGAVTLAKNSSDRVEGLGKAALEVSKVTATITEISDQTNLLALNATIEAARAGEAGKGFAVVANEIKELARQTVAATDEIRDKIEGIQNSIAGTIADIEQVPKVINDVDEIVSTIATAVEEQSVTTREIAGNVSQASYGILEVTENVSKSSSVTDDISREISDVNQTVGEIANSSSQVNISAEELSKISEHVTAMVNQFKV